MPDELEMRTLCSWSDWKKVCSFPIWRSSEGHWNPSKGAAFPVFSFISLFPSSSWELSFKSVIMGGILPFRKGKNKRININLFTAVNEIFQTKSFVPALPPWCAKVPNCNRFSKCVIPPNIKTNNLYSEYSLWFLSVCCFSLSSSSGIKSHWVYTFKIPIQMVKLCSSSTWSVMLHSCGIMGW